jgi:hypothetical protein
MPEVINSNRYFGKNKVAKDKSRALPRSLPTGTEFF